MTPDQLSKRQRKYAATLLAKGKIDAREFGMMLSGRLEYSPGSAALFDWRGGGYRVTGWPARRFYRSVPIQIGGQGR